MQGNRLTALRAGLLALPLFLVACGQEKGSQGPQGPPEVTVARPVVMDVMDWDEYTGRLEAVGSVEVRARVSGYLESVNFEEGAVVEKGDLLFVVDPRPYRAVAAQARAGVTSAEVRLELARNDLARARKLFESRAISEEELDARNKDVREAVAALEAARAAVEAAELDLEFTSIRAPIRGRVGRKLVTVGNLVSGGTAQATLLTTVVSIDPIHVYFDADERAYLRYLRLLGENGGRPDAGDIDVPVRLQLSDEEGFPHEGRLDFIDNRVDEATGTMQGRAVVPNPDGLLTPGLFARVQLLGRGPYEAVLVPESALGTDQSRRFVYLVDGEGQAARRDVKAGRGIGSMRIIREGLDGTERVVIKGLQRVRVGKPVKATETELDKPESGQGAAWNPPG